MILTSRDICMKHAAFFSFFIFCCVISSWSYAVDAVSSADSIMDELENTGTNSTVSDEPCVCVVKEASFTADGLLDDALWENERAVHEIKLLRPVSGGGSAMKHPEMQTSAKLVADMENLYFGVSCKLKGKAEGNDTVELFVDPGLTGKPFRVEIQQSGNISFPDARGTFAGKVKMFEDHWQAELKIPFLSMPVTDTEYNEKWGFDIVRRNGACNEISAWSEEPGECIGKAGKLVKVSGLEGIVLSKWVNMQLEKSLKRSLSLPDDRVFFANEKTVDIPVLLDADGSLKNFTLSCEVIGRDGVVVEKQLLDKLAFTNTLKIPLDRFKDGRYSLNIEYISPQGAVIENIAKTFWKIPPDTTDFKGDVYTIKNKNFYKNGKFFFPIMTWGGTLEISDSQKMNSDKAAFEKAYCARLAELKKLGFNAIISSASMFPDVARMALVNPSYNGLFPAWRKAKDMKDMPYEFPEVLRLCQKYDIAIVPHVTGLGGNFTDDNLVDAWLDVVLRYRGLDNIFLWHTTDEWDAALETNRKIHNAYKLVDPKRHTWVNVINGLAENINSADVLSSDPYPIPNGWIGQPAARVSSVNAIFEKQDAPDWKNKRSNWIWLQIFADGPNAKEGGWTRAPYPEEIRCMVFSVMNHGVNGISYFIFQDESRRDGLHSMKQEGYDELARINRQITEYAPVYCLGRKHVLSKMCDGKLDVAVIEFEGYVYVSCVNMDKDQPGGAEFTISLPAGLVNDGSGEVLFEKRNVELKNNALKDSFKPLEVHIYKFRK